MFLQHYHIVHVSQKTLENESRFNRFAYLFKAIDLCMLKMNICMYEGMCPGMFDLGIFNYTIWETEVLRFGEEILPTGKNK